MRTALGVISLTIGIVAVGFTFLHTDQAVDFFQLSGEHARMGVQWLGIFIWLPLTIVAVALFTK